MTSSLGTVRRTGLSRLLRPSSLNAVLLTLILGWLVLVPIILMVVTSFKPQGMLFLEGFTLEAYREVLTAGASLDMLWNTIVFVGTSVVLSLIIALVLAWVTERTSIRGRGIIRTFVILPVALPPMLLSMAWVTLASPRNGVLNTAIEGVFGIEKLLNIYSMPGMIFVLTLVMVPTAYLILMPSVLRASAEFEEAARASGASYLYTLRRVSLPMLTPAILSAAIFLTLGGIAHFEIPGSIGMPVRIYTLSTQIYTYINMSTTGFPAYGHVGVMGLLTVLFVLPLILAYLRLTSKERRFVTLSGKGGRAAPLDVGSWGWLLGGFAFLYVLFAVILPLLIVGWLSLMPYQTGISRKALGLITLKNYASIFANPGMSAAAINTVIVGLASATLVIVLSVWISYSATRTEMAGRKLVGLASFMPQLLPGVILGAAVTYVYIAIAPTQIYGTIWILIIAMTTSYIAYGTRATGTALLQSGRVLEEAALTSGAGISRTLRRIVLPLLSPALWGVWIWVLAHALRELSLVVVLSNERNSVVSTVLWQYWSSGRITEAAALGILLSAVVAVLIMVWQLIASRGKA